MVSELYFLPKEISVWPLRDKVISLQYAVLGYLVMSNGLLHIPVVTNALTSFSLTALALCVSRSFFSFHWPLQVEVHTALLIVLLHNLWISPHVSFLLPQYACLLNLFRTSFSFPDPYFSLPTRHLYGLAKRRLPFLIPQVWFPDCQPPHHTCHPSCFPYLGQTKGRRHYFSLLITSGLNHGLASHSITFFTLQI